MKPGLISIAMPCYNAAASLPLALASLVAQSYPEWECIVVDDGSRDDPQQVVDRFGDARIRFVRLSTNQGAGVARQVALDQASGEFLCMLDADDWYYPWKLARQLQVVAELPQVVLVSMGMAIVDRNGELAGVRRYSPPDSAPQLLPPWRRVTRPPVPHAPSLVRMDAARRAGYAPAFRRGQDADFLLNILWESPYAMASDALYAYTEYASATPEKILRSYRYRMRMLWRYRRRQPVAVAVNLARTWLTQVAYRLAFTLNASDRLIAQRSAPPSAQDVADFRLAKRQVFALLADAGLTPNQTASSH